MNNNLLISGGAVLLGWLLVAKFSRAGAPVAVKTPVVAVPVTGPGATANAGNLASKIEQQATEANINASLSGVIVPGLENPVGV